MEKILKDYISICEKFKSVDLSNEKYKSEKHKIYREWNNAKYDGIPTAREIIDFYKQDEENFFNRFFYTKVLNPRIKIELINGEFELLEFLFSVLCEKEAGFIVYNMLDCFCDCYKGYKVIDLADAILKANPNFTCAIKYKHINLRNFLEYSIQNLPEDLFYSSEVTLEVLGMFFEKLDKYENYGDILGYDVKLEVEKYRNIYSAYKTFLLESEKYGSFANCLNELSIVYS